MMGLKVVDFDQSCGCFGDLDLDDWEMEQHKIKEGFCAGIGSSFVLG